jgi:hypothetical protein
VGPFTPATTSASARRSRRPPRRLQKQASMRPLPCPPVPPRRLISKSRRNCSENWRLAYVLLSLFHFYFFMSPSHNMFCHFLQLFHQQQEAYVISVPVLVKHNNGTLILCGKAMALTGSDYGDSRPPTDRKNKFMTSATINFLNCDGYVLVGDQYYFVQKCKLLDLAKTGLSSKVHRQYKCVSVKYQGVDKPRLLWLDQPFSQVPTDRPKNRLITDILESDDLVPIHSNPREAKKQVEALVAEVMQSIQGSTVNDEAKRTKASDDEEETEEDPQEEDEDEDEDDDLFLTENENETGEFGASQSTVRYQSQDDIDHDTATSAGDQWVSVHDMKSALDEKDSQIKRLEVRIIAIEYFAKQCKMYSIRYFIALVISL